MPRKWLTPDTPIPETTRCRGFSVPDDLSLVASVTGALLPLTSPDNWEAYGTMTPQEAADIMSAAFDDFVSSSCGGDCSLPGFDPPVKTYRRSPTTGRIEWQNDGVWEEPTGDYAIPEPGTRPESTNPLKECGASSNAANVLRTLYTNILAVYDAEVDPILNQTEIAAQVAVAVGSMFGPVSASFLALSGLAWDVFTQALAEITEDDWSDAFQEELVCILNSAATVTDGVVTFDFFIVDSQLVGFILPVIDEFVRVRWQTWYLLQCIGAQGLNLAGATTAVSGDCVTCDTWCVRLTAEELGVTIVTGYLQEDGTLHNGASGACSATKTVDTTHCQITRVGVQWGAPGGNPTYYYLGVSPSTGGFPYELTGVGGAGGDVISPDNSANHSSSNSTLLTFYARNTSNGTMLVYKFIVVGTGINPFGIGSNC